jgi:hypothetical protein
MTMDKFDDIVHWHIWPLILPLLTSQSAISHHNDLLHRLNISVIYELLDHYVFLDKLGQWGVGIWEISQRV